jgi:hypothetical protein
MASEAGPPGILSSDRIVGVCRILNDGDVIFANLSRLADYGIRKFILSDMQSSDNSRAEIQRFAQTRKDATVFIIDDPGRDILGSKIATGLAALAASALDAVWVLPFDPDDFFWIAPGARIDLDEANVDYIRLPWLQVHPQSLDGTTIVQWLGRDRLEQVVKLTVAPGKVLVKWRDDLVIERGHHWLHSKLNRVLKSVRGDDIGAAMVHIPMRSREQILEKIQLQVAAEKIVRGEFQKTTYSTIAAMTERDGTNCLVALIDAMWRKDQAKFLALCQHHSLDPKQFGYMSDLILRDGYSFEPPDGRNWQPIETAPKFSNYRRKDAVRQQKVPVSTRLHAALLRIRGYRRAS